MLDYPVAYDDLKPWLTVPGPDVLTASGLAIGDLIPGFIARLDREYPLVVTPDGALRAEHAVALLKSGHRRVVVGDHVYISAPETHDKGVIEYVCDPINEFSRWDRSTHGGAQVLAANMDAIIIVQALGRKPVDTARLARALVVSYDCGIKPIVVLTKADRKKYPEDLQADISAVKRAVSPKVDVHVTSSVTQLGVEEVRELVVPGDATLIFGESGAGKSTLLNRLVGEELLETAAVREKDDKGRHTTVARRMIKIPNAGVIIDTPGLRTLPLLGHEPGLEVAYPEIARVMGTCQFRNCAHTVEPGCAVQKEVKAGRIDEKRLADYLLMDDEMKRAAQALDPSVGTYRNNALRKH